MRLDFRSVVVVSCLGFVAATCGCNRQPDATAHAASKRPPVPVVAIQATLRNIPLQVRAIGNVEAYSTISVKSEVGGELTDVYFKEGDYVKKGQILFKIDPRPFQDALRQAEANLEKDAAQARYAQADANRYDALYKEGVVAKEQADQYDANAGALEGTLAADRAAIANAKLQLLYTSIDSPIDGRTGNLAVNQGNLVKADDIPMVTINQIEPIYVTFAVPEQALPEVKARFADRLPAEATIKGDPRPARGTLTFIDNAVDATTGTIKMKGTFPNHDYRLWPGQFVNVVVTAGVDANAVVVPSQAVQVGQNGQYVYVVKPDRTVEYRLVTVGQQVGDEIVIQRGLSAGETVVTDGQSRLTPGAAIEIVKQAAGAGSTVGASAGP